MKSKFLSVLPNPFRGRRPLFFCPDCLAKICWATEGLPIRLHQGLIEFFHQRNLTGEAERARLLLNALTRRPRGARR